MRKPWTEGECRAFLHSNQSGTIAAVSLDCGRSVPAILHMRRKLKRLVALCARLEELPKLLTVSTWSVERCGLREIRRRARMENPEKPSRGNLGAFHRKDVPANGFRIVNPPGPNVVVVCASKGEKLRVIKSLRELARKGKS